MIGFSIEFKRWYITLRGPRGRVYLCTGFAKRIPVFISPAQAYKFEQSIDWDIDDSYSAILADEYRDDIEIDELNQRVK